MRTRCPGNRGCLAHWNTKSDTKDKKVREPGADMDCQYINHLK